jgi:hypothetical protein
MNVMFSLQPSCGAFSGAWDDPQITSVERCADRPGWVAVTLLGHPEPVAMRTTSLFNFSRFRAAVFDASGIAYARMPNEDWEYLITRFLREEEANS